MKVKTIYLDNNKIELFNSLLGTETIKLNGEKVSSKFSVFGTEHIFKIKENNKEVECKLTTGLGFNGMFVDLVDLIKGDQPIIQTEKSGCIRFVIIIAVVAIIYELFRRFIF